MVDVSQASSDISIVGGPSIINLVVDAGPQGQRGSQIFTGPGNPTDSIVQLPAIQINDMFINLNPESGDYLYLWQYNSQDGVVAWRKALRLIPNTILVNPVIKFINGLAHTTVPYQGAYIDVKGVYFPLAAFGETTDVENLNPRDFNIQMNLISDKASAYSLNLKEISNQMDVQYLYFNPLNPLDPENGTYKTFSNFDFQANVLSADINAVEYASGSMTPITGYRVVHILATLGGKSETLLEFDATDVNENLELISISNHGLASGTKVVYLKNPVSSAIGGLADQGEYYITRVDEDTIQLRANPLSPAAINLSIGTATGVHAISVLGVGL